MLIQGQLNKLFLKDKIKATEVNTRVIIYYIFEQSKETKLEFAK